MEFHLVSSGDFEFMEVETYRGRVSRMDQKDQQGLSLISRSICLSLKKGGGQFLNVIYETAPESPNPCEVTVRFGTAEQSDNALLPLLASAFGGYDQFSADLELEIAIEDHKVATLAKDLKIQQAADQVQFTHTFSVTGAFQQNYQEWVEAGWPVPFTGKITVVLKISPNALDRLQMDNVDDPAGVYRQLRAAAGKDHNAVIIASNGARIRCHRGFLSAHSPVFKAMFESSMMEGLTSVVEISDMSESTIRSLIAYLYSWELKDAINCSSTAMDLLLTANIYDIPRLRDSVRDLMLVKDSDWWVVSPALQMLLYARNRTGDDTEENYMLMEEKGLQVLKSKSIKELEECPEFIEIFSDVRSGMEFASYLLRR